MEPPRILEKKMEGRRSYLKRTGLVLLSLAVSSKAIAASNTGEKKSPKLSMIIDMNRCMGCHSCTIACKDQNQTPHGFFNTQVPKSSHGSYPHAWQTYKPELCNHCDNAPCIAVCDYDATFQLDNGIVVVDWSKCTGCGECVPACPYDARFLDPEQDNKADKCDFCITRLEQGLEPACVETCPAGARIFGDLENPQEIFATSLSALEAEQPGVTRNSVERVLYTSARKG